MPDRTVCPRCQKLGFVRSEHVIKGGLAHRHFYCGACHHAWAVTDDGEAHHNHGHLPDSRSIDPRT